MRLRSITVGAIAAVLCACVAMQWLARGGASSGSAAAPVAEAAAPVQERPASFGHAAPATGPMPAAAVTAKPEVKWRAMQARLRQAPNLRAFYYEAVQKPQDGGYFYGDQILSMCRAALQAPPDPTAQRRQVVAAMRERCDLTAQDLEDAQRHFLAIRGVSFVSDPLYGKIFDMLRAKSDEARAALMNDALDFGNPDVIGSLVSRSMERELLAAHPADENAARGQLRYAMALVQCRLGADCGSDSPAAQVLCVREGWCADSVEGALRLGLPGEFKGLDELAGRTVAAVWRRDVGSLLVGWR